MSSASQINIDFHINFDRISSIFWRTYCLWLCTLHTHWTEFYQEGGGVRKLQLFIIIFTIYVYAICTIIALQITENVDQKARSWLRNYIIFYYFRNSCALIQRLKIIKVLQDFLYQNNTIINHRKLIALEMFDSSHFCHSSMPDGTKPLPEPVLTYHQ